MLLTDLFTGHEPVRSVSCSCSVWKKTVCGAAATTLGCSTLLPPRTAAVRTAPALGRSNVVVSSALVGRHSHGAGRRRRGPCGG